MILERKPVRTLDSRKAIRDRVHGPQKNRFRKAWWYIEIVCTRVTGCERPQLCLGLRGAPSSPQISVYGGGTPAFCLWVKDAHCGSSPAKGGKLIAAN